MDRKLHKFWDFSKASYFLQFGNIFLFQWKVSDLLGLTQSMTTQVYSSIGSLS